MPLPPGAPGGPPSEYSGHGFVRSYPQRETGESEADYQNRLQAYTSQSYQSGPERRAPEAASYQYQSAYGNAGDAQRRYEQLIGQGNPQVDQANQLRGMQLAEQAATTGMTPAYYQARQGIGAAQANQWATAGSQVSPLAAAAAQRGAADQSAALGQQGAGQLEALRANEMATGAQRFMGAAANYGAMGMSQQQLNDMREMQLRQMQQSIGRQGLEGKMAYAGDVASERQNYENYAANQRAQDQAKENARMGTYLGLGTGIITGGSSLMTGGGQDVYKNASYSGGKPPGT